MAEDDSINSLRNAEAERIRAEYRRREEMRLEDRYAAYRIENHYFWSRCRRDALNALNRARFFPAAQRFVLEVGCGIRGWLPDFERWGVPRNQLAGIDLVEARAAAARELLRPLRDGWGTVTVDGADIREGDASELPWESGQFDLVIQSTVFSSVLDGAVRQRIAAEMLRVLKPGGLVLWYDLRINNPRNPNVRGVGKREVHDLFPGCEVKLSRVTLLPPLARRLVPWSWGAAMALEALRVLNTHYLGIISK